MPEIINATGIARIIQCSPVKVRHKMRTGEWKFGRVIRPYGKSTQYKYEASIGEVAKYIDIPREEAEKRLREG